MIGIPRLVTFRVLFRHPPAIPCRLEALLNLPLNNFFSSEKVLDLQLDAGGFNGARHLQRVFGKAVAVEKRKQNNLLKKFI